MKECHIGNVFLSSYSLYGIQIEQISTKTFSLLQHASLLSASADGNSLQHSPFLFWLLQTGFYRFLDSAGSLYYLQGRTLLCTPFKANLSRGNMLAAIADLLRQMLAVCLFDHQIKYLLSYWPGSMRLRKVRSSYVLNCAVLVSTEETGPAWRLGCRHLPSVKFWSFLLCLVSCKCCIQLAVQKNGCM